MDERAALELLLGRVDLSQRAYNSLRDILSKANVRLPTYKKVMDFEKTLDVGIISPIHDHENSCLCQGYQTKFHDTLQRICGTPQLYEMFEFLPMEKQTQLFEFLKSKSSKTYGNLNSLLKTIVVRETGIHDLPQHLPPRLFMAVECQVSKSV